MSRIKKQVLPSLKELRNLLLLESNETFSVRIITFFKNPDVKFLGIPTPRLQVMAKQYSELSIGSIQSLLQSSFHEERLMSLLILRKQFDGFPKNQRFLIDFYLKNTKYLTNWCLVDSSAPYLLGKYLWSLLQLGEFNSRSVEQVYGVLHKLLDSKSIWDRRVAIVSTLYFIRLGFFSLTFQLVRGSLDDPEILIHKACGWMLREIGKRDDKLLRGFLNQHLNALPRTTLRYAIEKFSIAERNHWLYDLSRA